MLLTKKPEHRDFVVQYHFLLVDDEGPLQTVVLPKGGLLYKRLYDAVSDLGYDIVEWLDDKTVKVEPR